MKTVITMFCIYDVNSGGKLHAIRFFNFLFSEDVVVSAQQVEKPEVVAEFAYVNSAVDGFGPIMVVGVSELQ